ncbi:hypothetical protein CkaCkLH20_06603 [Colletotrichum karsti]|uniref:Uncharacterized protein n=1 Tax=Colletotrichum karsti TaxID=1095194 RepID=A0A9P6I5K5_9PEZI|nr:uncharacterized protein CkaCkLH20_06603 [Colletotrichum karsti]KAF9876157.1 hypothetical protein CkaCkLH20_06603 [Colletotrichum karsti]
MIEHAKIIEEASLIEDTNMNDEADLRRLPGLRFPGRAGEPVSRQNQVGWQMFFGPSPESPKHLIQLATYASRWLKAAVEVLEETKGTGEWDDVLQKAAERLQARDRRKEWTAGATQADRGAVMMTIVGARELHLKMRGQKVGGLRGRRPRNIPKGFRPFLASLDRWIEASVWLRLSQAISGPHVDEGNEDAKKTTAKRAFTPVEATEELPMKKARYFESTSSSMRDEGSQTALSATGYLSEDENVSNSPTPPQNSANNVDLIGVVERELDYEELASTIERLKDNYKDLWEENKMLRQKFKKAEAVKEVTRTAEVEVGDPAGADSGHPEGVFGTIKRRIFSFWG